MGKHGPAPKPLEQKRLEGTTRPDRDAPRAARQAPAGRPKRPEGLTGEALELWKHLAPKLVRLKTLARVDGGMLEGYCRTLALARRLDREAEREPIVRDRFDAMVPNPAGVEARKLWPVVQKLAADLGLSYAARSRAPIPTQEDGDPTARFLFDEAAQPPARA